MVDPLIRYLKLVQEPGKLELLVLRAHMLSEEHLRSLIDIKLPSPQYFKHRSFSFAQCLSLAKAMYHQPSNDWVWECLTLLNSARNSMAHKLQSHEDCSVKDKLDRIDALIGNHGGVPMPSKLQPSVQRMHWRLASLYAFMSKLGQAQPRAPTEVPEKPGTPLS